MPAAALRVSTPQHLLRQSDSPPLSLSKEQASPKETQIPISCRTFCFTLTISHGGSILWGSNSLKGDGRGRNATNQQDNGT